MPSRKEVGNVGFLELKLSLAFRTSQSHLSMKQNFFAQIQEQTKKNVYFDIGTMLLLRNFFHEGNKIFKSFARSICHSNCRSFICHKKSQPVMADCFLKEHKVFLPCCWRLDLVHESRPWTKFFKILIFCEKTKLLSIWKFFVIVLPF